jgi:hypothetical protein
VEAMPFAPHVRILVLVKVIRSLVGSVGVVLGVLGIVS